MNVGIIRDALMYAKGYKKVALRDTKGILNKTNNHKWVKETKAATTTVLPSGTIVQDYYSIVGHKCKKVIKPKENKMFFSQRALRDEEYMTPMKGYDNISLNEGIYNFGTVRRPCYMSESTIKFLKTKSEKEALAEQAKVKEEIQIDKTRQKRLKFIERFKQKYDRKTVQNPDGSRRKCIIDKKTGDEVWFWEKDPNGRTTTGDVLLDLGGYKEVITSSSDGSFKVSTHTQMPGGKIVTESYEIK